MTMEIHSPFGDISFPEPEASDLSELDVLNQLFTSTAQAEQVSDIFARPLAIESGSGALGTEFDGVNLGGLSPAMILALTQQRLKSIDSAIMSSAAQVTARDSEAQKMTRQLELLHEMSSQGSADGDGDLNITERVGARAGQDVAADLRSLGIEVPLDGDLFRRDAIAQQIEKVNGKLKQLNSDNEMTMIRLQDAMQSRTALISLATNVLNTMHEAEKNVIGNMR
ncbi:MAG: hypothetical protein IPK60_18015 [Sandaracinaceae bacterium]|jgi:hypothetical protein|nr:hypothetical protein [Sandaracinaceae bacterium]